MLASRKNRGICKAPKCFETLNLENSSLSKLPASVLKIGAFLRHLYLSGNMLRRLPDDLFAWCPLLRWFDARFNELTSLPSSLRGHKEIQTILVEGNLIEKIPFEIVTCIKLVNIHFNENPLKEPPPEYLLDGIEGVKRYYEENGRKVLSDQDTSDETKELLFLSEVGRLNRINIIETRESSLKRNDDLQEEGNEDILMIRREDWLKRRRFRQEKLEKVKGKKKKRQEMVKNISRHWRRCVVISRITMKVKEKNSEKIFFEEINKHGGKMEGLTEKMKDICFSSDTA